MRIWSIGLVGFGLLLSACGASAPQEAPEEPRLIEESLPVIGPQRRILAFGDSLFAGYNLEEGEGYPERLEGALRARGINAQMIDAGVSGDTSAAGAQRLPFVLDNALGDGEADIDLAIVELGGNDLLRALSPEQTKANLAAMIEELQSRDIPVLLMGMRAPANYGPEFQVEFDGLYPALAEQYNVALVPFFMQPMFEDASLFLPDHIHPTARGVEELVVATIDHVAEALPKE